jgi:hypothetical protein
MATGEEIEASLAAKFQVLLPHLDERQRRLLLGAECCATFGMSVTATLLLSTK